jgi:glycosyltransferase involved in cell wall biosynthesis
MSSPSDRERLNERDASAPAAATRSPRVSIGLPVFNGERFLAEAIGSILAQTFEDLELIISDNASTDDTEAICRGFAEKDDRVRYVRNRENLGAAYNFNQTFHLSSGEYFKWAAHDDLLDPRFVERCVDVLERDRSVAVSYSRWGPIGEEGERIEVDYGVDWRRVPSDPVDRFRFIVHKDGKALYPIFGLFRSDVLVRTGLHPPIPSGDWVLTCEVGLHGGFRELDDVLFLHRWHAGKYVRISTFKERIDWWLPAARAGGIGEGPIGALVMFVWTRIGAAARVVEAIRRSPLPRQDRMRCYLELPGWAWGQLRLRIERRLPD